MQTPPRKVTKQNVAAIQRDLMMKTTAKGAKGITIQQAIIKGNESVSSLETDFGRMMTAEIEKLFLIFKNYLSSDDKKEQERMINVIYLNTHNLRGEAGTFGYHFLTKTADFLCKFIEIIQNKGLERETAKITDALDTHLKTLIIASKEKNAPQLTKEQTNLLENLYKIHKKFKTQT